MDEIELRLAAMELALIETLADQPPETLRKARARLKLSLAHDCEAYETAARTAAMDLIKDAEDRHKMFARRFASTSI